MQEVYKAIGRVAGQDVTVLIRGESGTGKELVARAIYQHSRRADGPFLAVNCAAIPETLLESELFGHEKGAFTGADRRRIGKFEQCSGGTLFLDEIGDMTPLTAEQDAARAAGAAVRARRRQRDDRRPTSASSPPPTATWSRWSRDGEFREDLYYRLNGFTIALPPLRERGDDIAAAGRTLPRAASTASWASTSTAVSPEALDMLLQYPWPGNVRELQSVLKQALLHARGSVLLPEFLPPLTGSGTAPRAADNDRPPVADLAAFVEKRLAAGSQALHAEALEFLERYLLRRVLNETEGNQSHAARILGITRGSLRNKLQTLGISIEQVVNVTESEQVGVS